MDTDHLRSSLARLAADLTLAGEPIALDVVVERHLKLLSEARTAGLRWTSLARLIAEAGARRPDGGAISADQLRASYSRAARRRTLDQTAPAKRADPDARATKRLPYTDDIERPVKAIFNPTKTADISSSIRGRREQTEPTDIELASARSRLGRTDQ